jgi:hypothetical protein
VITYTVRRIVSPWASGVGDLAGRPVTLIEFRPDGGGVGIDEITSEVLKLHAHAGPSAPQWVLFVGDESQMDNDLFVFVRTRCRVQVAAQVSGIKGLGGPGDRTPVFDHTAVRANATVAWNKNPIRVQRVDSFVLYGDVTFDRISAAHRILDVRGYEGRRYVEGNTEEAASLVVRFGRGWRLTWPTVPETGLPPAKAKKGIQIDPGPVDCVTQSIAGGHKAC